MDVLGYSAFTSCVLYSLDVWPSSRRGQKTMEKGEGGVEPILTLCSRVACTGPQNA
jgi:hypothetical protein